MNTAAKPVPFPAWPWLGLKLLDRYLLREILGYTGLGLGVFLFILLTPEVLRLSELLARENVTLAQVGQLLLYALPAKLVWAIPLGVLAGLLMGLSRAAADSEIIALQAAGVGLGRLLRPLLIFASAGALLTLFATAWWGPRAARGALAIHAQLAAGQISYEIKPRVFDERLPNHILYVQDIEPGAGRWKGVFLANLSQPSNPTLTVAEAGAMVPEPALRALRLHLQNGSTHSYSADRPDRYSVSTFAESVLVIPLPEKNPMGEAPLNAPLSLAELWRSSQQGERWRSARADFHRRLALPAACLLFGLIALPLGMAAQRTGRAVGFVAAVGVATGYYFVFLVGDRLGRQGNLSPGLGVWLANLVLLFLAAYQLVGQTRPPAPAAWRALGSFWRTLRRPLAAPRAAPAPVGASLERSSGFSFPLPPTLDLYVTRGVLFHSLLLLLALLLLFGFFTLVELVDEIAEHHIAWSVVARFLWYLLPQAVYWMLPLAVLLGVLVELAVLSKRNELVAIKGAGISLYRIAVPLLAVGLGCSALLFWLDNAYLPQANQQQEILRNQIKGRPPQTIFRTDRRWIFGQEPRIYHYAFFDPEKDLLGRLNVLEFSPEGFSLRRRLFAQRAHWDLYLRAWVLEEGWERAFRPDQTVAYHSFVIESHPELSEPPAYFHREVRESAQMNWRELGRYIGELEQGGFEATRLRVQWHKKFAFPLMAAIMV
ncbi:MAG: LPS export ABC transporter permease LptF, partial [Candidatus Acidiferrales bacterium]